MYATKNRPNKVGSTNVSLSLNKINKRFCHNSTIIKNNHNNNNNYENDNLIKEAIKGLYKDRVSPVNLFDNNKIIAICYNILN